MKKRNIQEAIEKNKLKMKYHAGIISESEFQQMSEIEIQEPEKEEDRFRPGNYFSDENKKFSPESENDSNRLLHALLKTGVVDFKKYPEWVFKALSEDGYVEQEEGTGAWFLSNEGKSIFRTPQKFQQYLITADEEDIVAPEVGLGGELELSEEQDPGNHMYPLSNKLTNAQTYSREDVSKILDWLYNHVDNIGRSRVFDLSKFLGFKTA